MASIRARLLVTLLLIFTFTWLLFTVLTFFESRHEIEELFDAQSTPKITGVRYDAYDAYGNLVQQTDWGTVTLDANGRINQTVEDGDERTTYNEYLPVTLVTSGPDAKLFAGKLFQTTVYEGTDNTGTQLAQRRFYYDGSKKNTGDFRRKENIKHDLRKST